MGLLGQHNHPIDKTNPNTRPGAISDENDGMTETYTGHALTGNQYDQSGQGIAYHEHALAGSQPHTGFANNQARHPALRDNRYDNTAAGYDENFIATGDQTPAHGWTGHHHGTTGTGYNGNSVAEDPARDHGWTGHQHGTTGTGYDEDPVAGNNHTGMTGHTHHNHALTSNQRDTSLSGTHQHEHIHGNHHHEEAAAAVGAATGAGVMAEKRRGRSLFSRHPRKKNVVENGTTKPRRKVFGSRTHRNRNSTAGMSTTTRPRFGQWLKATWLDLLTMVILGAVGLGVGACKISPSQFTDFSSS